MAMTPETGLKSHQTGRVFAGPGVVHALIDSFVTASVLLPSEKLAVSEPTGRLWMHDGLSLSGASAADLGGPEAAGLGQAGQHLMRERNRGLGNSYGKEDVTRGLEGVPDMHGPDHEPSLLRPRAPLDQQNPHLGLGASHARPEDKPKGTTDHGAALAAADVRRPLPTDRDHIRGLASPRDFDPSMQQKPTANCGSLLELLKSKRPEVSGPEPQGAQTLNPSAQRERTDHLPLLQGQDLRKYKSLPPQGQPTTGDLSVLAVRQDPSGPADKIPDRFKLRGIAESGRPGFGPVIPAETGEEREIQVFPPEDAKHLSEANPIKTSSKAVHVPGQTGRRTQAPSKSTALSFLSSEFILIISSCCNTLNSFQLLVFTVVYLILLIYLFDLLFLYLEK